MKTAIRRIKKGEACTFQNEPTFGLIPLVFPAWVEVVDTASYRTCPSREVCWNNGTIVKNILSHEVGQQ